MSHCNGLTTSLLLSTALKTRYNSAACLMGDEGCSTLSFVVMQTSPVKKVSSREDRIKDANMTEGVIPATWKS